MSSARERACRQPRSWMTLTSVNKNARLWKARDWNVCWFALSWGVHNAKCGMKGGNYGPESDALLAVLSVFTFCCICYVCWRTGNERKFQLWKESTEDSVKQISRLEIHISFWKVMNTHYSKKQTDQWQIIRMELIASNLLLLVVFLVTWFWYTGLSSFPYC